MPQHNLILNVTIRLRPPRQPICPHAPHRKLSPRVVTARSGAVSNGDCVGPTASATSLYPGASRLSRKSSSGSTSATSAQPSPPSPPQRLRCDGERVALSVIRPHLRRHKVHLRHAFALAVHGYVQPRAEDVLVDLCVDAWPYKQAMRALEPSPPRSACSSIAPPTTGSLARSTRRGAGISGTDTVLIIHHGNDKRNH